MGRLSLLIALVAAQLAAPAAAQEPLVDIAVREKDRLFAALDADHDSAISRREATRHPALSRNFTAADEDGDGRLSPLEFRRTPINRLDQPGWSRTAHRA